MIVLTAKIYISETKIIEINRYNLLSMSSSIFDRSDLKLPNFGIISNKGEIEFSDNNGKVFQYAKNLQLIEGLKCEMFLTNTLVSNATTLISKMETDQWDYDNDSKVVSVSLKDDLEEWQDINVDGVPYDPRTIVNTPFKWFYEYLWDLTSNRGTGHGNYDMLEFEELDKETKNILENTFTQYKFLNKANLWQQWTKLCQACQLHIYKNNQGTIVCRYNGGN